MTWVNRIQSRDRVGELTGKPIRLQFTDVTTSITPLIRDGLAGVHGREAGLPRYLISALQIVPVYFPSR